MAGLTAIGPCPMLALLLVQLPQSPLESPRLTRLAADLAAGDHDAVDRFWVEVVAPGIFETARNGPTSISILFSSRHFRDVLPAKGYEVAYREVAGGHDPLTWRVSLPEAVERLLGPKKR